MKRYRFKQLNKKATCFAVYDYHRGLIKSRSFSDDCDDIPTLIECFDLCMDSNLDVWYDRDGNVLWEQC